MFSMHFSRASFARLLPILLLAGVSAVAKDGRDFSGFYTLTKVSEQGDQMRVTLTLQLFNYSDTDVKQAVVTLRENTGMDLAGAFKPITLLRDRQEVKVSRQFTVPRTEYERWQQGTQPTLFISYHANGHRWERFIQATERPSL
jgi:hypothetical protein